MKPEEIHPSITAEGFYHKLESLSRLDHHHPAYGECPSCGSNNTLPRELLPRRLCLTCGHTEDFDTFEASQSGWRPIIDAQQRIASEPPLEQSQPQPPQQNEQ